MKLVKSGESLKRPGVPVASQEETLSTGKARGILEFLSPFLWRAPTLEMRRER